MNHRRFAVAAAILALTFVMAGQMAWAHQTDRAEHHSEVRSDSGEVEQLLQISATDLIHNMGLGHEATPELLEEAKEDIKELFADDTAVLADGEMCQLEDSEFVQYPGGDGRVHFHQLWQCPERADEITVANRLMVESHDGYRHMGQIQVGDEIYRTVFDSGYPTFSVYPTADEEVEESQPGSDDEDSQVGGLGIAVIAAAVVSFLGATVLFWRRRKAPGKKA